MSYTQVDNWPCVADINVFFSTGAKWLKEGYVHPTFTTVEYGKIYIFAGTGQPA